MTSGASLIVPFTRERDAEGRFVHPPLHLRPWTPEELEQHQRMIRVHEALHRLRARLEEKQP